MEVKGAGPGLHHRGGVAGQGVEELPLLQFADERLAGRDQGLELAGLAAEVAQLPEPVQHAGGLVREEDQAREVARAERRREVAARAR